MVFEVLDRKDKCYYAVKLCKIDIDLNNEIETLKKCSHKNIIRFHDCFKEESYIAIKMELATCDLNHIIKTQNLSKDQMFEYTKQICDGLAYLHNEITVIHRDIKPGNILFNQEKNELKIADFGESKVKRSGSCSDLSNTFQVRGTKIFLPPEALKEVDSLIVQVNDKTDIWSLGVLLHKLYTKGEHPFGNKSVTINKNVEVGNLMINKIIGKSTTAYQIIKG